MFFSYSYISQLDQATLLFVLPLMSPCRGRHTITKRRRNKKSTLIRLTPNIPLGAPPQSYLVKRDMLNCAEQNAATTEMGEKTIILRVSQCQRLYYIFRCLCICVDAATRSHIYSSSLQQDVQTNKHTHTSISMCEGLYVYVSIRFFFFLLFRGGFR